MTLYIWFVAAVLFFIPFANMGILTMLLVAPGSWLLIGYWLQINTKLLRLNSKQLHLFALSIVLVHVAAVLLYHEKGSIFGQFSALLWVYVLIAGLVLSNKADGLLKQSGLTPIPLAQLSKPLLHVAGYVLGLLFIGTAVGGLVKGYKEGIPIFSINGIAAVSMFITAGLLCMPFIHTVARPYLGKLTTYLLLIFAIFLLAIGSQLT